MADTTLQAIRNTIRLITKSLSNQITDTQLDQYINLFVLYKMPQSIKLKDLRTTLTFYTQPNVDFYPTNTTDPTNPLYDFKNRYTNVHVPVFFAGVQGAFYQDRQLFYAYWPKVSPLQSLNITGDGVTTTFSGVVPAAPMLQNDVTFSSIDISNNHLVLVDYPVSSAVGALGLVGQPQTLPSPYGSVNYITGAYSLNFPTPPAPLAQIYVECVRYQPGIPTAILYYDDAFTLRPVPDKTYTVQFDVDRLPTELLNSTDNPDIKQWSEYIAVGAARSVFRDRMDMDSLQKIEPMFRELEEQVLTPTVCQKLEGATYSYYRSRGYRASGWPFFGWPF